jgi:hypothetical protein
LDYFNEQASLSFVDEIDEIGIQNISIVKREKPMR